MDEKLTGGMAAMGKGTRVLQSNKEHLQPSSEGC